MTRLRRHGDEEAFEAWLEDLTERLDPVMAWLGVMVALLLGYELAVDLSPGASTAVTVAGWALWSAFFAELAVELYLAPRRLVFLRRRWLQVLALALPVLRVLRFLRLLRLGRALPAARVVTSSYRTAGSARRLLRSRLGYLAALGAVGALAVAELAFLFERQGGHRTFTGFGDAVLWSLAVVVGMQGDPTPQSTGARLVMIAGFAIGLVVIASVAGIVGAHLVGRDRAPRPG